MLRFEASSLMGAGLKMEFQIMKSNDANTVLMWALREALPLLRRLDADLATASHVGPDALRKLDLILTEMKNATKEVGLNARRPPEDLGQKEAFDDANKDGPVRRTPKYNYWARVPEWSIRQAVLLVSDFDPETFPESLEIVEESDLYLWMTAAQNEGNLPSRLSPSSFLQWFDLQGYDEFVLPPRLRQAIVKRELTGLSRFVAEDRTGGPRPRAEVGTSDAQATSGQSESKPLGKRERDTLHILLVHFMETDEPVVFEKGKKPVSESMANTIADALQTKRSFETVQDHLNAAVATVRQMIREKSAREPPRN
jgi:hypothetical protein